MRKQKWSSSTTLNLTPLIDIVFQLLAFFMISSAFVYQSSLEINLPSSSSSSSTALEKVTRVTLLSDQILLNDEKSSTEGLKTYLENVPDISSIILTIEGDKNISYQQMIDIIDIAKEYDVQKINLATYSRD